MANRRDVGVLITFCIGFGALVAPASAGNWQITPSISANETVTDNVDLVEKNRTNDWITDISPGLNIVGRGDRANLRFDYRMHNLYYANDSSRNNIQNSLNADGTLEALENWFYIDASALISQQNLSAFGGSTDSSVDSNDRSNTTETSTYRISPYFKGTLGASAEYMLRYNLNKTTSDESRAFDTQTRQLIGRLAGRTRFSKLSWSVDANSQKSEFESRRDTESDLVRGTITYEYDPQFRISLIAGRESNDYASSGKESHTIKGAGFEWAPTERTLLSAHREDRFFGNSDNITFTHRTAGTVWKYRQTKDASTSSDRASGVVGTNYDLVYALISAGNPSLTPEQVAFLVNQFLLASGISGTAQLQGGFLTTGVTLQQRRELSFALIGARNTVTFAATQSETKNSLQGAGIGLFVGTDFANLSSVEQKGVSVNVSHKLTGLSTLTGTVSRLKSSGKGDTSLGTKETMFSVNFLTQLGPKTNAGLGARRTEVDGTTNYTENALIGTISHRF